MLFVGLLLLLVGLFGGALFLLKALGWVIVTSFHIFGVIILAMIVWASILYWRKRLSGKP